MIMVASAYAAFQIRLLASRIASGSPRTATDFFFDLTAASAFADLAGSPPQARYVAVIGRFLVLSGLPSNPYRIQWSGLNATTAWTAGVAQAIAWRLKAV